MYSRINNDESSVGGLILAAGLSTRMGQSKPLTKFLDKKLIEQTIKTMQEAGIDTIWNPNYGNGSILTSIKTGLAELTDYELVFIQLVDLPCIMSETYQKLLEAMLVNGKKAVLPTVNGRRGHPALIRMDLLADILAYEESAGGGGLRGFWKQLGDAMMELPVDDRGCIMDTDTKEQLQEAENYMRY